MRPGRTLAPLLLLVLLTSLDCSLLLDGGSLPDFTGSWIGCYRSTDPQVALILERAEEDRAVTGCLVSPAIGNLTVAGVPDNASELELMAGGAVVLVTRDDGGTPDQTGDDTVTLSSGGQSVGPVGRCGLTDPSSCDQLMPPS